MDYQTAMNLIASAVDLDELRDALNCIEVNCDEVVRGDIDYSDLPTFGGVEPADTTGIWSWDETRLLIEQSERWMTVPRPVTVTVANPWTGATVELDITDISSEQFAAYTASMSDDVREELHARLAPCTIQEFIRAYVEMVGPEAAGRLLLS